MSCEAENWHGKQKTEMELSVETIELSKKKSKSEWHSPFKDLAASETELKIF